MCGILGTLPNTEQFLFRESLDTLEHRGRDDSGIWNDNGISLGHRRLSILDLSKSGHQPMSYLNERYHIVFNGEIYNFLEIRQELEIKGYIFRSQSDTEVALASYIQWGEDCLLKFNGMWAFAIWDSVNKKLFLSRDRFGKKPLFYAFVKDRFIFASEMKAIYPFLSEIKPSSDFNWMKKNIFLYEGTEKCLVEGIKRFPAGYYGYFENKILKITRFWNTLDHLITPAKNYENQMDDFKGLFIDACKIRMRSDVPIGTALSGGLDSSAIMCAIANIAKKMPEMRMSQDWQHAFVASFPNTSIDETYYANKVVEYLGINGTFIDIKPLKVWNKLYEYFYLFEELYITSPIPMLMVYKSVKDKGVTVSIDGHGADELFSGYGHLIESLWDAGLNIRNIKNIFSTLDGTKDFGSNQIKKESRMGRYLKFMLKKIIKKLLKNGHQSRDYAHPNFKKMDNFSQQLYIIFHETILPTLLRNYDRYSMINGVEVRMPFMDYRLVSYVFSLPYSSKFGNGYTKKLIRDAMAPLMPGDVVFRKTKIGFNSPIVNWMQGELKEWFNDIIISKDFEECSLIENTNSLKKQIIEISSKKTSDWHIAEQAWTELTPYLWEKAIVKKER